jgi:PAS domain S-box-containing protein
METRRPDSGVLLDGDLRRLRAWRLLSASTVQDALAAIAIAIAAWPFVGVTAALWWLAFVLATAGAESLTLATRPGRSGIADLFMLIRSLAAAGLGLILISASAPEAALAGLAIWGAMVFRAIVVDYRKPRQLWFRVAPPIAAGVWRQINTAIDHWNAGLATLVATDLSILILLLAVFLTVYMTLNERRRTFDRILSEGEAKNRQLEDAQRIADLAEHLGGSGHFRIDRKTKRMDLSTGLLDLYQIDASMVADGPGELLKLHDESDQARINQVYREVVRTRLPIRVETRSKLRDGRVKHVLTQCDPELDSGGNVIGIIGVSLDVTETRRREAALSESEARLRLLADNISDIVIWVSPARRIMYASPSIRTLGFSSDSLVHQPLEDLIHPEDRARARLLLDRIFETHPSEGQLIGEFRFLIRRRIDEPVWLEGYANAVRDPEGRPRSAVINFRNVTQRRVLEEDLRLAKTNAEAAAQAKSEFLANMSHEVRTPLTGVIGFSTLLSQTPDLPPAAQTYIRKVITSGEALLSVVNDILDFSKLEAGQVDLDPAPFHLRDFLDEAADLFRLQAEAKGLLLRVQIDEPVPEHVLADRARVQQILVNLLSNALKFTEEGSIRIQASYDRIRRLLEVSVIDTGVGVDNALIEKLFQRFTQADGSISRRYGGSGLGLSISRQLTQLMNGSISASSTPGVGSTFTFSVFAPPATEGPAESLDDGIEDSASSLRILIVDDVETNREIVRALLEAAGQVVHEAAGGQQAVSIAVRETFDLILMDLQMPGMDGIATTRAIREVSKENRTTPIIALSANVLPEQVAEAYRAGMNDHVGKPIVPALLIAALNRWAGVRISSDADPVDA